MDQIIDSTTTVLDPKPTKRKYPEARIIVLDDNFNSFEHVANCLVTIIPGMSEKRSWELAVEVDREKVRRKYGEARLNRQSYIISNWLAKD